MLINFDSLAILTLALYALGSQTSKSLLSLAGTLAVALVLWALASKRIALSKIVVIGLAWTVFTASNLIIRPADNRMWDSLGRILILLVPLLGLANIRLAPKAMSRVALILALAAVAACLKSLDSVFRLGEPGAGFFGNPIYFAYATVPVLILFFESVLCGVGNRRIAVLGLCASLTSVFLSGNRMVLVFTLVFIGVRTFLTSWRLGFKKRATTVIGALGLAFVGLLTWVPFVYEKFSRLFDAQDPSRVWRFVAWRHNWDLFTQHFIFGVGFERNGIDTGKLTELAGHWTPGHLIFAHSIYFQWLAEGGFVGTILVTSYFALISKQSAATFWVVMTLAITGLTENTLSNFAPLHAFVFVIALSQIQKNSECPES